MIEIFEMKDTFLVEDIFPWACSILHTSGRYQENTVRVQVAKKSQNNFSLQADNCRTQLTSPFNVRYKLGDDVAHGYAPYEVNRWGIDLESGFTFILSTWILMIMELSVAFMKMIAITDVVQFHV